ncbi:hypothetical protein SRHO_G00020030 [Serrasalmus rhombeus]
MFFCAFLIPSVLTGVSSEDLITSHGSVKQARDAAAAERTTLPSAWGFWCWLFVLRAGALVVLCALPRL